MPWPLQSAENFTFSVKHPRRAWQIGRALAAYRKSHPECVITGKPHADCQVHHVYPVSRYPDLALDPANFRTVRRHLHRAVGHPTGFQSFNVCFDEAASLIRQGVRP